ncbi:hypothetical protein Tco_1030105 [Tanacetum coccineum]|uniref:Reverse transcriptase Ty1/copia-type domain-containing protein n=1 Tax=Tanacetum coccineum TaxID=301880 RepID=A0ABQ5G708_9ASTR
MMSFLKGQGYKNLQKLKYPQMKELYDKVQESIKESFKDFIPMGSEKEKQMLQERDAKRLLRKRKATITEEQPSKKLKLRTETIDELRNYLRIVDFEWRLNESSGVHTLELEDVTYDSICDRRTYPLSRELMIGLLDSCMEVEERVTLLSLCYICLFYGQLKMVMILKQWVSERRNRTLLDMVRSIMNLTTLPKSFWGYALESVARILNMVPTKKNPLENKIFVAQNAEFFENSLTLQEASGSHGMLEASESDVGLKLIQEDDTQPSENTSKRHDEIEPNKHELGDINEPPNYKAALLDLEFDKWLIFLLMQASRSLNKRFDEEIKKIGFMQNSDESCVYLKASGSNVAFLVLYIDDIFIMGEAAYILGIKIICDRSKRLISLNQSAYFDKILKKFKMKNSKRGSTPMQEKSDYIKFQGAQKTSEVKGMQNVPYASAIGSIMYGTVVKTIFKYLRNTKDMVLVYGEKLESELKKSAKQSTTAMSSTEAEYIAAAELSMEAVWMRKFIDGFRDVMPSNKRPMEILCDNAPAITITNDPRIMRGARHYQRKYHYVREVIQAGEIVLKKVNRDDNLADPFTKPMPYNKHSEHDMEIGVCPASSLM